MRAQTLWDFRISRGSGPPFIFFPGICGPNGDLLVKTVELAKEKSLQAVGIAMHVLADTWAHRYFAGTPSQVINNTDYWFYELIPEGESFRERAVTFRHNPTEKDDLDKGIYTNTVYQFQESSVMSLGHGRAGHLPDYSFMRYKYLPAWGDYEAVLKDNPSDYYKAFCQMVYAMKYLRGEYADAKGEDKVSTFLGNFFSAALAQKGMVTDQIFKSGNLLAGYSVEYRKSKLLGSRDFILFVEQELKKRRGEARS